MSYSSNQKRRKILTSGKDLFWKYGFKRVTVEEICAAAGVSKMTFYKYFSNKMELIKIILGELVDESIREYREIMESEIPFSEKITKQIEMKMKGTAEMSNEFMNDLMLHAEPEILEFYSSATKKTLQMIHNDYVDAQKKGDIRKDIKPEFIIYFLNHIYTMLVDEKLNRLYDSPNTMTMELMNFFFYGLLGRNEEAR